MKKNTITIIILILVILFLALGLGGTVFYFTDPLDLFNKEEVEEEKDDDSDEYEDSCESLWWYDEDNYECDIDEFCGTYMYQGLMTFDSREECEESLNEDSASEVEQGYISGSVSYPSEYIPEDMEVCAESLDSSNEYCEIIEEGDDYTYGWGYSVSVPYGDYYVYSQIPGDDYKSYYSEFVTCGLSVDCPSHDPIEISVDIENSEWTGIDPIDWYNN